MVTPLTALAYKEDQIGYIACSTNESSKDEYMNEWMNGWVNEWMKNTWM